MNLLKFRNFLKKKLLVHIKDPGINRDADIWIDKATEYTNADNKDSNRLAICICIDLKYDLLRVEDLLPIFEKIDYKELLAPHQQFEKCLVSDFEKLYQQTKYIDSRYAPSQYVTVVAWAKMYRKCKKIITSDRNSYINSYNIYAINKSRKLSDFDNWNGDYKRITWVFDYDVLLGLFNKHRALKKDQLVDLILDRLGLHENIPGPHLPDKPSYVYIIYPLSFSAKFACHQPSALSGSFWNPDELFLSYKALDGYGRTYSTSGRATMTKERVFAAEKYANREFIINELGIPSGSLIKNTSKILVNAQKRFDGKI